jgi:hypothetical protein
MGLKYAMGQLSTLRLKWKFCKGTGSLSWTASEEVDWLTLSSTSGDSPDTLTVTADPTQVTAGTPVETLITIQGDNGQSLELPFNL